MYGDEVEFGAVCGVEACMRFAESVCRCRGYVGGKGVWDTEKVGMVFGVVAKFAFRRCGNGGGGVVVGCWWVRVVVVVFGVV